MSVVGRTYSIFQRALDVAHLILSQQRNRLLEVEHELLIADTNFKVFDCLLDDLKPDALLSFTPYLRLEYLLLRAAYLRKLPMCTAIISFDNLTTRGWIPAIFDAYFLWNKYNQAELYRAYPEAINSQVVIVGAPQFDFYWDKSFLWDETHWRQKLGLPFHRPVILFGAGPESIAPHEPHWLGQLDRAITDAEIPDNPVILLRRHPNDPFSRWKAVLEQTQNVVYDEPWPAGKEHIATTNVNRYAIEKLVSTLSHSAVHISCSSTMSIDGAIFDRPQIGPAYDDRPGKRFDRIVRELYLREHYLPITNSGGLAIAYSRSELLQAITSALNEPEKNAENRRRMVLEICTYADGQATTRLNQALRKWLT